MRLVLHATVLLAIVLMMVRPVAAEGYTSDDTLEAISEASATYGVSEAWLRSIVRCETGGSFSPYAIGRQGELGPVQLHPRGELPRFYAWGYGDPFDPYQAVPFLAQRINQGGARAWSCA